MKNTKKCIFPVAHMAALFSDPSSPTVILKRVPFGDVIMMPFEGSEISTSPVVLRRPSSLTSSDWLLSLF